MKRYAKKNACFEFTWEEVQFLKQKPKQKYLHCERPFTMLSLIQFIFVRFFEAYDSTFLPILEALFSRSRTRSPNL